MHKLHRYKIYDIDSCYEHIFSKQLTTITTAVFSLKTSHSVCNCKFQVTLMPFTQLLLHPRLQHPLEVWPSWHSSVSGKLCSPSWPWSCCAFVPLSPRKQKIISPHMLERLVPQQDQEPTCYGRLLVITSLLQSRCVVALFTFVPVWCTKS